MRKTTKRKSSRELVQTSTSTSALSTTNKHLLFIITTLVLLIFFLGIFFIKNSQRPSVLPSPPNVLLPTTSSKATPSVTTVQSPKRQAVIDVFLSATYLCEKEHAQEVETGLNKIQNLQETHKQEVQDSSDRCYANCSKYSENMKACSTKTCLDSSYESAQACTSDCGKTLEQLILAQTKAQENVGLQVYALIDKYCITE